MEHKVSNELPPIPGENTPMQQIPQMEVPRTEVVSEVQTAQAIETGAPAQPLQSVQGAEVQSPLPQTMGAVPVAASAGQLPGIADDTDLIEKEWVEKAKEIVARTKHDPYQQNKEVERMKADYMKKRYNKDIRVTED